MLQACSLHGGGFSSDTVLLSVEEEGDGSGRQEDVIRSVSRDDTFSIVELKVSVAELCGPTVR